MLLISLLFIHFIADYTHLSTPWMLKAKRYGDPWFPILCHASVHGFLMALTMVIFRIPVLIIIGLTALQIITHFGIDVLKGKMNIWYPKLAGAANPWHWYVFGADQFLHTMVIILMTYLSN